MRARVLLLTVLVLAGLCLPVSAAALDGSSFNAGRIIDDQIFFNNAAMDAAQIQAFLESKVPVCDTNGQKMQGSQTRAEYGAAHGNPAPFVCLKDYQETTADKADTGGICGLYSGGTKTASQIIYDVAQSCGINPQVLITLLQKEQNLVTDDWPWANQYRNATGFGCADVDCDPSYQGFTSQVYGAARMFRMYATYASGFQYHAGQNNTIQYSPNQTCGSSTVFIENQATAGLYNYSPYQPNAAALNNLYGTGDACSSYGNRNFWRYFNEWFGSSIVVTPAPVASATLTVNGQPEVQVAYGSSVALAWSSENVTTCALSPTGQTTLSGSQQVVTTSNTTFSLSCNGANGPASATAKVTVLPATFAYLRELIQKLPATTRPADASNLLKQVNKAEKDYKSGDIKHARDTLNDTVSTLAKMAPKQAIPQSTVNDYSQAVSSLITPWGTVTKASVTISDRGCTVTAYGPPGFVLEYGATDVRRGFGDSIVIPASGKVVVSTGAPKGWTSFGKVKNEDGKVVDSDTTKVRAEQCSAPGQS